MEKHKSSTLLVLIIGPVVLNVCFCFLVDIFIISLLRIFKLYHNTSIARSSILAILLILTVSV